MNKLKKGIVCIVTAGVFLLGAGCSNKSENQEITSKDFSKTEVTYDDKKENIINKDNVKEEKIENLKEDKKKENNKESVEIHIDIDLKSTKDCQKLMNGEIISRNYDDNYGSECLYFKRRRIVDTVETKNHTIITFGIGDSNDDFNDEKMTFQSKYNDGIDVIINDFDKEDEKVDICVTEKINGEYMTHIYKAGEDDITWFVDFSHKTREFLYDQYSNFYYCSKKNQYGEVDKKLEYKTGKFSVIENLIFKNKSLKIYSKNSEVKEIKEVTVSNVNELVAAIAPNTHIKLQPGVYNLSDLDSEPLNNDENLTYYSDEKNSGFYIQMTNNTDTPEGLIYKVDNLTLEGLGEDYVEIVSEPRTSNVLVFSFSNNVKLKNLKIGHTMDPNKVECERGVLSVNKLQNFNIEDCLLYGCGTIGIEARNVNNLSMNNSIIQDCTHGIMYIKNSYNISFQNSEFRNCHKYSMIGIYDSFGVEFRNCSINDNWSLGKKFQFISTLESHEIMFVNCEFKRNTSNLFTKSKNIKFINTKFEDNTFIVNQQETESEKVKEVIVSDVYEFVEAIASNTHIKMKPGLYNITDAVRKYRESGELDKRAYNGSVASGLYFWDYRRYNEAVVMDIDNLIIEGLGEEYVEIVSEPRRAQVMCFQECENVTLRNLKLGHTEDAGPLACDEGVIGLYGIENIYIENSLLYGCGTEGIIGSGVKNLYFDNSIIEECTRGIMYLSDTVNAKFTNSEFRNCEREDMINFRDSSEIEFNNCSIYDNYVESNQHAVLNITNSFKIKFLDCDFRRNDAMNFIDYEFGDSIMYNNFNSSESGDNEAVEFINSKFEDNTFKVQGGY